MGWGERVEEKENKKPENTKKILGVGKTSVSGTVVPRATASAAPCSNLWGRRRARERERKESNCDIALWLGIATQCNSAQ